MTVAAARATVAPTRDQTVIHVIQGEFRVASSPEVMLTTILGSCVAACLFDPDAGVGGMNHFLLPGDGEGGADDLRYGVNSMELLINALLSGGARRGALRGKLFGGAEIVAGLSDVGGKNAAFAAKFLEKEGIPCVGGSLGGRHARRIQFWPATGRARQNISTDGARSIAESELITSRRLGKPATEGDLELF